MNMLTYVMWPGRKWYEGPYNSPVEFTTASSVVVRITTADKKAVYDIVVPRSICITADDGEWTLWTGNPDAAPPPYGAQLEVTFRNGDVGKGKPVDFHWAHKIFGQEVRSDIIAYRIIREVQIPLSLILNRDLWWEWDEQQYTSVVGAAHDGSSTFNLANGDVVARDWFRGRSPYTTAELEELMKGADE